MCIEHHLTIVAGYHCSVVEHYEFQTKPMYQMLTLRSCIMHLLHVRSIKSTSHTHQCINAVAVAWHVLEVGKL